VTYTDQGSAAATRPPVRRMQEEVMAVIVIKDLPDSVDLDREAMTAITGGARTGARHAWPLRRAVAGLRIISYPEGFPGQPPAGTRERPAGDLKRGK